jgi:hypothetical protein
MTPLTVDHAHTPVFRIVRRCWTSPLDTSRSRLALDNRWNDASFPTLYCSCSERVARFIARDFFDTDVGLADLAPGQLPRLLEIEWSGAVADVASAEGVAAAGFPAEYPAGVSKVETRERAAEWRSAGLEGVVCRSASALRGGESDWSGPHERYCEVAILVDQAAVSPTLRRVRDDLDWLEE